MRTRSVAAALLIAFTPLTLSMPGFAQEDPTVKAARARFNEGVEFFDKGQYENARASFLQAYALHKHPAVLLNLAQSTLRAGHSLEAAKYFEQYLHDSPNLTALQRADAEKGLAEARTKLGRLEISAPSGAEVFVDGDHVGTAPLSQSVDVEPGSHTVKAGSESRFVNTTMGQSVQVRFGGNLAAVPVPAPLPVPASPTEEAPTGPTPPPAATEEQPASPPPNPAAPESGPGLFSPPRTMAPVWIGVAAVVVGTGTAVLFAVFKGNANSSITTTQQTIDSHYDMTMGSKGGAPNGFCNTQGSSSPYFQACQNLSSDINQVNTDATLGNVGVGVAIAGAVFGLGWYLFAPKRDAKDSSAHASSITPVVDPHYKGLSYSLSF